MGRLYRPHIPLSVRVNVATRQLSELLDVVGVAVPTAPLKARLDALLGLLAKRLGCDVSDLRLDHDPPLGARTRGRAEHIGGPCQYFPDANDPDHLFYRPHGPQFAGSHLIKTNVRGDHGQHPDRVLIKKQRRIERGPKPKRGPKIRSRGFDKQSRPFHKRTKQ